MTMTLAAIRRNRAARNSHQAQWARHDIRTWQIERMKRTRHLIELVGLGVKAGVVDLTNDDRAVIFGAIIWIAEKLNSDDGERAQELWVEKWKVAFEAELSTSVYDRTQPPQDRT